MQLFFFPFFLSSSRFGAFYLFNSGGAEGAASAWGRGRGNPTSPWSHHAASGGAGDPATRAGTVVGWSPHGDKASRYWCFYQTSHQATRELADLLHYHCLADTQPPGLNIRGSTHLKIHKKAIFHSAGTHCHSGTALLCSAQLSSPCTALGVWAWDIRPAPALPVPSSGDGESTVWEIREPHEIPVSGLVLQCFFSLVSKQQWTGTCIFLALWCLNPNSKHSW